MTNRIMVYILILLAAVAIVYRVANPPKPPSPGPVGGFPNWKSHLRVGKLTAQAVNPSGTAWAGVWNEKTSSGELKSALCIVDFKKYDAKKTDLRDETFAPSLGWTNDKKIWVLTVDSEKPSAVAESSIQDINASDGGRDGSAKLKTPITHILTWPTGTDRFLAALATDGTGLKLAVLSKDGEVIGKEIVPDAPDDAEPGPEAALASDGETCVFSVADPKAGGGRAFYLGKASDGTSARAFDLTDVPGRARIESMWIAGEQVLIVSAAREQFRVVMYDLKSDKFTTLKRGIGAEAQKSTWAGVPEKLMLVTYNGGYEVNVASGKVKKLFDYSGLGNQDDYWRREVINGRLYPIKGGYIAVSMVTGDVDIRELDKEGRFVRNLLPRM